MTPIRLLWVGDVLATCQLCPAPLTTGFIDGRTVNGPWAIMCPDCHAVFGCGLGTGNGQRYEKRGTDWEKVEG
jgi:hypothetical protein